MFFVFDGLDGVGKSTQQTLLTAWLEMQGARVVSCRDPGATPLGERLRSILLDKSDLEISPVSEMLLYMTARSQLVAETIRPAIESGAAVVCDRYLIANIAYQGYGAGVDIESIRQVGKVATDGVMPDATFLLDMPTKFALGRLHRTLDRVESRGEEYFDRVRQGFLTEAKKFDNVHVIDASRSVEQIQSDIRSIALAVMEKQA
ncbi:dTMP kinase [Blastopirellula sp. JC732]|uniref:Thymidylate kinase n=1 Tax=Blastopirellula sediminis TaxID=2894196 RepID=A0A9X1MI60_9BACT|nr:dTMP kinase [Blastopirellula sediminis]MCC9609681.1 dTMP kinase [Blastopirellula sediminis]MCC9627543.1 dTMP kinase [Blastopirellula sediminis]